jgi:nicotinamidase-related amidase
MSLLDSERSVLVVIDLQGKLAEQVYRPDLVRAATLRLLALAELFGVPVVLTEQYPRGLGATHPEILAAFDALTVPKVKLDKTAFGCFGDAGFEAALEAVRPAGQPGHETTRQLVIAGIETHVCVMQTVLVGLARGFDVHVCWDAVSGRGAEYREHALARMRQAGAVITNHESVGFEWAREKDHPRFRAMSALFKEGQPG